MRPTWGRMSVGMTLKPIGRKQLKQHNDKSRCRGGMSLCERPGPRPDRLTWPT
jgi:hypothetical protein